MFVYVYIQYLKQGVLKVKELYDGSQGSFFQSSGGESLAMTSTIYEEIDTNWVYERFG